MLFDLHKFHLSHEESTSMLLDIMREMTVIFVVHLLTFIIDERGELFGENIFKYALYVTIALVLYNVAKKIFTENNKKIRQIKK